MREIRQQPESFEHEVLDTAMDAGNILLENGAELARVEDTMDRICRHYGVDGSFFILSNGIFTTGSCRMDPGFARVRHIPVNRADLSRVVDVNQLSRDIEKKDLSLEEVQAEIIRIRQMPGKRHWLQILAAGIGSAGFCYMFGGSARDCVASGITGLLLWIIWLYICMPHLSRILGHLTGGAAAACFSLLLYSMGIGDSLSHIIIGAVIPLVPGVPFTNGIRDIASGDYLAGIVRLLDALLVFMCIAIGVGFVLTAYYRVSGGAL